MCFLVSPKRLDRLIFKGVSVKNIFKVLSVVLLTAFSAASAMDNSNDEAEKRYLQEASRNVALGLAQTSDYLAPADVVALQEACVKKGLQASAHRLWKARGQDIIKQRRDATIAAHGQPLAARVLTFSQSSSSSSSSSSQE
jgi:hypothetical protein